jgi:3-hydroxyisobutyryl-CoA hydrolase
MTQALAEFDTGLPSPRPAISGTIRKHIDSCFAHDSPLKILSALESVRDSTHDEEVSTWATKTINTIRERSPIGVAVTLRALREGRSWNIAQAFRNEHAISSVFMTHADFVTGVTARLIKRSKGRPDWKPNQLEDVRDDEIARFFAHCNADKGGLALLESGPLATYASYPHAWTALPSEAEIRQALSEAGGDREAVVKALLKKTDGKVGVREKCDEVFERID